METIFRIAEEKDIEAIINLCNECFLEETKIEKAKDIFNKTKNDENTIYLVGEYAGKIVAHARIAIIETMYEDMATFAILNHICVKEEYRKHKIGTEMLKVIEKTCKDRGCKSLKLWSNNFRIPAHSCYLKFGFVRNDATFFSKDI